MVLVVNYIAFWIWKYSEAKMRAARHCVRLGAKAACTLWLMEEAQMG
jgi:hypothetical protein